MHPNRTCAKNQFKPALTGISIDCKTNQHIIDPARHLKLHTFLIVVTPNNDKGTAIAQRGTA